MDGGWGWVVKDVAEIFQALVEPVNECTGGATGDRAQEIVGYARRILESQPSVDPHYIAAMFGDVVEVLVALANARNLEGALIFERVAGERYWVWKIDPTNQPSKKQPHRFIRQHGGREGEL